MKDQLFEKPIEYDVKDQLKLRKTLNDKDGKEIETLNDNDVGMFYCPYIPLQVNEVE